MDTCAQLSVHCEMCVMVYVCNGVCVYVCTCVRVYVCTCEYYHEGMYSINGKSALFTVSRAYATMMLV